MKSMHILLDTVEKVKGFVNLVAPLEGDMDLGSDRYIVDAKSIMGIFSLDLSKPLKLTIHEKASAERLLPLLQAYIV
ncbi:MAG: HPr family phosphocarrier protein [Defluviitaleaceae bacterium]|nr:HPr family phosphocarrier protein [Defluviitaleaceae bacterium]